MDRAIMNRGKKISNAFLIAGGLVIAGATVMGTYATFKGKLNAYPIAVTYALGVAPLAIGYGIRKDIENQERLIY